MGWRGLEAHPRRAQGAEHERHDEGDGEGALAPADGLRREGQAEDQYRQHGAQHETPLEEVAVLLAVGRHRHLHLAVRPNLEA